MYKAFSSHMSYAEYVEMMRKSCEILKEHFSEISALLKE